MYFWTQYHSNDDVFMVGVELKRFQKTFFQDLA